MYSTTETNSTNTIIDNNAIKKHAVKKKIKYTDNQVIVKR